MHPTAQVRRVLLAVALAAAASGSLAAQSTPATSAMDDEQFLTYLESSTPESGDSHPELDQRRLAKLMFSIGATLGGGKSNVRLLQGAMRVREPSAESTREMAAAGFERYDVAVEEFRTASSRLLDAPQSERLLFRVMASGHEVCWRLDAHTRLMETYGVSANELLSILSSREACGQFRRAAFSAPVEGTIEGNLDEAERLRAELRDLQREMEELEKLVRDLNEIEGR